MARGREQQVDGKPLDYGLISRVDRRDWREDEEEGNVEEEGRRSDVVAQQRGKAEEDSE